MIERSVNITFGSGALVEGGNVPKAPINLAAVRAAVTMPSVAVTSATSGVATYYLDGVGGSDSDTGLSWSQAWLTPAYAAANAPDMARIWVAPATYTLTSTVSYAKRLWWQGPYMPADQIQAQHGSAWFEATGSLARYFDISNADGGGFSNIGFSNRPVTAGIIRVTDVTNFTVEKAYTHPTNPVSNSVDYNKPLIVVEGAVDSSGLSMLHCDAHSSPLIYAHPTGKARNWRLKGLRGQSDIKQSQPFVDLAGDFDGLYLGGGYLEMTDTGVGAIKIDMTGVATARRVTVVPGGFERLNSPYYGVALYNCQVDVGFAGGQWSSNGYIYGDANCTGYVMVPTARLAGSLVAGVN